MKSDFLSFSLGDTNEIGHERRVSGGSCFMGNHRAAGRGGELGAWQDSIPGTDTVGQKKKKTNVPYSKSGIKKRIILGVTRTT